MLIFRVPVILAIATLLALAVGCSSNVPEIKSERPIEYGQFTLLKWAVEGNSVKGLIRNNGKGVMVIGVDFKVYDKDGYFLSGTQDATRDLDSGETWRFDAYNGFPNAGSDVGSVKFIGINKSDYENSTKDSGLKSPTATIAPPTPTANPPTPTPEPLPTLKELLDEVLPLVETWFSELDCATLWGLTPEQHQAAVEYYTKAIQLDPNDAEAYIGRGGVLRGYGYRQPEREGYRAALEYVVAQALAVSLDKPLEWATGFFFRNVELSLELWTTIAGISGFDD